MATRFLYLVRHGNYNAYEAVEDNLGGPLTPLGREQAEYTGKYLASLPIDRLYSSPMRRAVQTTEVVHQFMPKVPIEHRPELWEVIPVVPFRLENSFKARFPEMNADKLAEQNARAETAFANFFQPVDGDEHDEVHDLLICHGNLIRYLICRALNVDPRAWGNMIINQGSISRVVVDPRQGMMLASFNESLHMPEDIWVD